MNINSLDLNLLRVLDALLEERNVTRAARRLGLSQPAVSHALGRLRRALEDPLLVRTPAGMVPTPRGDRLRAPLRDALRHVETALTEPRAFDPATARLTFTLASNDFAGLTLVPGLAARVTRAAPGINLHIVNPREMVPAAELAAGTIDLAFSVRLEDRPGLYQKQLFTETFGCLVREGHPSTGKRLTLKQYLEHGHLLISPFGGMTGTVDDALAKRGLRRDVRVAVPQFGSAPWVLLETDLVLTLPSRIASPFARRLPVRQLAPPLELEGFPFYALWNERTQGDPAHRWLRDQLFAVAREL